MKNLVFPLLLVCAIFSASFSVKAQRTDITIIKERILSELLMVPTSDARVKVILQNANQDGSFKGINYADLSRTASFPHAAHTADLAYLARAYQHKTSQYYKSDMVKEVIIKGLEFWVKNDFVGENWHDNQIATPTNLVNLLLAIGDELPKDLVLKTNPIVGRANMEASGARPSGDRIVIAGILAKHLLFLGDFNAFEKVIKIIGAEMKFATGERGIQQDYSFHHRVDRVNNTTSYGYIKFANAYGEWATYAANTQYAFSLDQINMLVNYYLDGVYKQMVYGVYIDVSVKNRDVSLKSNFEPQGTLEIERILALTDYRKKELIDILNLRKGLAQPQLSFAKFFWQSEHFVFQRPHFYTTVRMYSTRNYNMEEPYNGPGITTHHRADGTNYLMLKGNEYQTIWPMYDWQKISGTTIMQKPSLPAADQIQKPGLTDFVGAVTDGIYGAVAFDFKSAHDLLVAKKAWFFFDEEYICLGAGIKSNPALPVFTTINQVLMKTPVTIAQQGMEMLIPKGKQDFKQVKWVYQDSIGYLFPTASNVTILNDTQSGRWSDITAQKNASKTLLHAPVFMLGFDHGISPNNASYAYIVVPAVSKQQLSASADQNRGIEILANTSNIQAVRSNKQHITQAAFYTSGVLDLQKGMQLKMQQAGMVMFTTMGSVISSISVADPSRKLNTISFTLTGIYPIHKGAFVSYPNKDLNETLFVVTLPQTVFAGTTVTTNL